MATIEDDDVAMDDRSPLNNSQGGGTGFRCRTLFSLMRRKCLLPFLVVLVIVAVVCFSVLFFMQPPAHYGPSEFYVVVEDYWDHVLRFDPITATFVGNSEYNDQWPVLTNASLEAQQTYYKGVLSSLESYKRFLNDDTQLSFSILTEEIQYRLTNLEFQRYMLPILQMGSSPQVLIPQLIGATPFNSDADYYNYLQRLKELPLYLQNITAQVNYSESLGITLPKVIADLIPPQIDALLVDPADSVFFHPFVTRDRKSVV